MIDVRPKVKHPAHKGSAERDGHPLDQFVGEHRANASIMLTDCELTPKSATMKQITRANKTREYQCVRRFQTMAVWLESFRIAI